MSAFFSERELADMRADSTSALPDTCYIYRKTMIWDGAGGVEEQWTATTLDPIPVELFTGGGTQEVELAGAITGQTYWKGILPYGTDVQATDRLQTSDLKLELITVTRSSYKITTQISGVEVK